MRKSTIGLVLMALALGGCPPGTGLPGGSGVPGGGGSSGGGSNGELSAECRGDFGTSEAAAKVETFMLATARFTRAAADLDGSLKESCQAMGRELGLGTLSGDTRSVCDAAGNKLRDELQGLRAEASLRIEVAASPPICEVSVNAYAGCYGECQVDVDPGEVSLECEGGEIVGQCSAECTGSCSVEIEGQCTGSCQGTCQAGCTGVCEGVCEGECSATGPDGQCNGTCSGTCHGSCSAGCEGSCEGECRVSGQASCEGECSGGCSVEYTEPRCTGTVRAPSVSAECQASCEASLEAEVECQPGRVEVVIVGEIGEDLSERVQRVRGALQAGWGQILVTGEKLQRLRRTGRALADATGNLRGTGRALGLEAVSCITEAAAILPASAASVTVSVEVQVSVSASASAG